LSGLGIVRKNRRIAEIASLEKIKDCMANLLIFRRLIPVISLRTLATSSRGLKKDYPWSDDLEKLPAPSIIYGFFRNYQIANQLSSL
jgi:hypothetical protein